MVLFSHLVVLERFCHTVRRNSRRVVECQNKHALKLRHRFYLCQRKHIMVYVRRRGRAVVASWLQQVERGIPNIPLAMFSSTSWEIPWYSQVRSDVQTEFCFCPRFSFQSAVTGKCPGGVFQWDAWTFTAGSSSEWRSQGALLWVSTWWSRYSSHIRCWTVIMSHLHHCSVLPSPVNKILQLSSWASS